MLNKLKFIISLFILSIFSIPAICIAGQNTIFQAFRNLNMVDSDGSSSTDIDTPSTAGSDIFISAENPFSFYNAESEAFDKKILRLCGAFGSKKPTKERFIAMLKDPENEIITRTIYDALNHEVITPNANLDQFVEELSQVWFNSNGFTHIFCGQPRNITLGGLHFNPRLVEVSQTKRARIVEKKLEPVYGTAYTVRVEFLNRKKEIQQKDKLTLDKTLHANDILAYATQAFKMIEGREGELYYGLNGYTGVFIKRDNAIITFYPKLSIPVDSDFLDSDDDIETDSGQIAGAEVDELPGDDFYEKLKILIEQVEKKQ
ncbi:EndoU domain-containing protein [Candidatus Mesenet endosymbiont of Phosphuga atrata]|uniref:EndoU domain-containing protein n=1 Tax=Candidatus Mesenet endosymbiont of Phosphuga atrata TaxID=3066221 RepID=UPI0030D470BD